MKKNYKLLLPVFAALVLAVVYFNYLGEVSEVGRIDYQTNYVEVSEISGRDQFLEGKSEEKYKETDEVDTYSVTLSARDSVFISRIKRGATVYDVMENLRQRGLVFESRLYEGLGYFIVSIGGIKNNGIGGRYWTLYINNERSNLGASSAILNEGDEVEWRFEKEL